MTGYFSAIIDDKVEILADRASYDADGVVTALKCKIRTLPHGAVIMVRGLCDWADRLETAIERGFSICGDFDQATAALEASFANAKPWLEPLEATLCGVGAAGPAILFFRTKEIGGKPAWVIERVSTGMMDAKVMPAEAHARLCSSGTLSDKAVFLMEELRSSPGKSISFPGADDYPVVGGGIDLAVITADGVTISGLHDWPDAVGQRLKPRPSEFHKPSWAAYQAGAMTMRTVQSRVPAMSRQQRRAAKAKGRAA